MLVLASLKKDVGPSCIAALHKADEINVRSATQVCCHVHMVHAVCRQRKVRRFPDFPENIHFCDGH